MHHDYLVTLDEPVIGWDLTSHTSRGYVASYSFLDTAGQLHDRFVAGRNEAVLRPGLFSHKPVDDAYLTKRGCRPGPVSYIAKASRTPVGSKSAADELSSLIRR